MVAVVNDSVGSTKLGAFRNEFPDRLINVGIAEQNMVGVGAGLANGGLIPFVCAASCFLTARALEQIKADAAYSQANVKLVGVSSGMAYGELGPTHHSIEDIAWLRAIADLHVVVPADPVETDQAIRAACEHVGPVFVRTSRTPVPAVNPDGYQFQFGKAAQLRDGDDATHHRQRDPRRARRSPAAELLSADGIEARVLNMASVSPPDRTAVIVAARETGAIVTVEEHSDRGGLGGLVAEIVVERAPGADAASGRTRRVRTDWLLSSSCVDHFGLNAEGIRAAVRDALGQRSGDDRTARAGDRPGHDEHQSSGRRGRR